MFRLLRMAIPGCPIGAFASALAGALLTALACFPAGALAAGESGLKVPRFVSLRADPVNVRAGPGVRFPIAWVFVQNDLPVEVVAEYEFWRRIRDLDGAEGWVHKSLISGDRWAIVTGEKPRPLRREPKAKAPPVMRAEAGVLGRLLRCNGQWCQLRIAGRKGWIRQAYVWGAYPGETVD
ncbi:MAG: SH3 domain-containing protein [Alphaproteobacteria bacterium]|jgi:SH3-like domain-containing protein|nr:SH3 domain-containing protein [Alphaproteobacteria bacterium]MDP6622617.1 SH3 domain-containing protein [Alphaproteobacteria bacterium]|tara:strand:- start:494 stop:1033 length:540 start_codon:yes stop_codon:yes gene_type:complete